jgi:hypothetical protein
MYNQGNLLLSFLLLNIISLFIFDLIILVLALKEIFDKRIKPCFNKKTNEIN